MNILVLSIHSSKLCRYLEIQLDFTLSKNIFLTAVFCGSPVLTLDDLSSRNLILLSRLRFSRISCLTLDQLNGIVILNLYPDVDRNEALIAAIADHRSPKIVDRFQVRSHSRLATLVSRESIMWTSAMQILVSETVATSNI